MDRAELERYLLAAYPAQADCPWQSYPTHRVFRHPGNRKWFALVMTVPRSVLGLPGEGGIDIVNLKCDPRLIGAFRQEPGIYPGYHMNKENWLSAALDGSADETLVKALLDQSYDLTAPRGRKPTK